MANAAEILHLSAARIDALRVLSAHVRCARTDTCVMCAGEAWPCVPVSVASRAFDRIARRIEQIDAEISLAVWNTRMAQRAAAAAAA